MRRLLVALALTGCTVPYGPAPSSSGWTVNWDRVAWCESGGNWAHRPVSNSAGTFSGGLMIGHQYWDGWAGVGQPRYASKAQQIAWAENLIDGSYAKADAAWQCIGGPARSGV